MNSKVKRSVILLCLLGLSMALVGCQHGVKNVFKKDVVETAAANPDFSTLTTAINAAGLAETLKGKGPFTVFAPTNEAFKKLPEGTLNDLLKPESKEKLKSVLTYHVVPGKVMAVNVLELSEAKTFNGKEVDIKVEGGVVHINDAKVTQTDIQCANGVIHVIDSVLLP